MFKTTSRNMQKPSRFNDEQDKDKYNMSPGEKALIRKNWKKEQEMRDRYSNMEKRKKTK